MKTLLLMGVNPVLGIVSTGLFLGATLAVAYISARSNRPNRANYQRNRSPSPIRRQSLTNQEKDLRDAAQKALDGIGYHLDDNTSTRRARRGQHVINNGVLSFYRGVLADLLNELDHCDEQMLEMVLSDMAVSLDRNDHAAIESMVVHFNQDEFYVDYNAAVFGAYNRELRQALVAYLKAATSVCHGENRTMKQHASRVREIADLMNRFEVYVDPMARDRWISRHGTEYYEFYRKRVARMFQNILKDFQKVVDKIRFFCR